MKKLNEYLAKMLVFLVSVVLSAEFVPYINMESLLLIPMNLTKTADIIHKVPYAIVFIHDPFMGASVDAREKLLKAIPLFQQDLVFIQLDSETASPLQTQLDISPPRLLFYANGTLWSHYSFPYSETVLLSLLYMIQHGTQSIVSNSNDLYKSLGRSYYSLLYPVADKNEALTMHRFASTKCGYIDLIPFSNDFNRSSPNDIQLDSDNFYLFRTEDVYLKPIPKKDADYATVIQSARPIFKKILPNNIISNTNLTFAISVDHLTSLVVDILENVGTAFPNILVGFAEPLLHSFLNQTTSGSIKKIPSISLLNTTSKVFYPIPDEINDKLYNSDKTVINEILSFLSNLPDPIAISESTDVTEKSLETSNVTQLVGSNYDSFIAETQSDIVVLYYSRDTPMTQQFIEIFTQTANFFISNGITTNQVRFAAINVSCNSAFFPLMPVLPHMELFPKLNKTDNYEYFGQANINAIVRFVKRYSTTRVSLETPESTLSEDNIELYQIISELPSFKGESRRKSILRLEELTNQSKLNVNITKLIGQYDL